MHRASVFHRWQPLIGSACLLAGATLLALWLDSWVPVTVLAILYIVAVLCVAYFFAYRYAVASAIAAVIVLDVIFVHPRGGLQVDSFEHALVLVALLVVSLLASYLSARQRAEASRARLNAQRAVEIRQLASTLAVTSDISQMVDAALAYLRRRWGAATIALTDADRAGVQHATAALAPTGEDLALTITGDGPPLHPLLSIDALHYCARAGKALGAGTERWADLPICCVPMRAGASPLGALAVTCPESFAGEDVVEVRGVADMLAAAIQREHNASAALKAHAQAESQALRNTLLTAISHDFRTPLATIIGASSSLAQQYDKLAPADALRLASLVEHEARYLAEVTQNTLHWTRLTSGGPPLQLDWQSMEDILGPVVARTRQRYPGHPIDLYVAPSLPLIQADAVLLAQALHNLLDNAVKYSSGLITLSVTLHDGHIQLDVADRGRTLTAPERQRVFDTFYRGENAQGTRGAGLGLAITQAVANAHGATLMVLPRTGGGNVFRLALPIPLSAPTYPGESS